MKERGQGGLVEVRFVNEHVFSGDCFLDVYKYSVCEHQLALLIRYFKEKRADELPKDFMQEIERKENAERFRGLNNFLSNVDVEGGKQEKSKIKSRRVKFVFEFDGEKFEVRKRQVLRNNSLGVSSNTSVNLVKKNLNGFSKLAQKTFKLYLSTSSYEDYSYEGRNELIKSRFSSMVDMEVMKLLKMFYLEDNSSFVIVEFFSSLTS